ncbi:hypothetical protein BGX26_009329, partial [Mortierella sp. AD094]
MEQGIPPPIQTVTTTSSDPNGSGISAALDIDENEKKLLDKLLSISRNRYEQLTLGTNSVMQSFVEAMDRDMTFILKDYFQTKKELEKIRYDFRKLQGAHLKLQDAHSKLPKQREGYQVQVQNQDEIVMQLQSELQMTASELMRAMGDIEELKASNLEQQVKLQSLEREREEIKDQAAIKTLVNSQLAHILEGKQRDLNVKVKENSLLKAVLLQLNVPIHVINNIEEDAKKPEILPTASTTSSAPHTTKTPKNQGPPIVRWKLPVPNPPTTIDLTTEPTILPQ